MHGIEFVVHKQAEHVSKDIKGNKVKEHHLESAVTERSVIIINNCARELPIGAN